MPHLADTVFKELATEIVRGSVIPGTPLPAERVLSERFGVSKLLVRQAVHRLAEAGLVEVRQGGATRVLDPKESGNLQVIELFYTLAPEGGAARELAHEVLEKQFTQGMSLVDVFARRAPSSARAALVTLVEGATLARRDVGALAELETEFWTAVAEGGGNRILSAEVRWWYLELAARPAFPNPAPVAQRHAFYLELARRLRDDDAPLAYYVAALTPGIKALFAPKKARRS
ncbi:MAG: GntR family transcriptional regulator [Polyangiaceae bacterium]